MVEFDVSQCYMAGTQVWIDDWIIEAKEAFLLEPQGKWKRYSEPSYLRFDFSQLRSGSFWWNKVLLAPIHYVKALWELNLYEMDDPPDKGGSQANPGEQVEKDGKH
ncbi:protein of unknown function [Magnetospira sp. QH-2]|nr:protein of unknown function [Magnetospira sp. QH-2]